jgi:hypothetical protein
MKRTLVTLALVVVALAGAGRASAAIQAAITSPVDGAHSLSGVVNVDVTASADSGVYSVQLYVDGQPYGLPDTTPVGQYQYQLPWDTNGLPQGDHTLSVQATDWSGAATTLMSTPITVDVGPAYPTISLVAPAPQTFVRGPVAIQYNATSAAGTGSVATKVDGSPVTSPWDSMTSSDGSHMLTAEITDGRGKKASDSATVTVDNTPPSTVVIGPPAQNGSALSLQAHASDAYGIASVQFAVDGTAVGRPVTAPDTAGGYIYSATVDAASLADGTHTLTSVAVDNAGNRATSAPVSFRAGSSPLAVSITTPPDWTFAGKAVNVAAGVTGGVAPVSARLVVDGTPVGTSVTTSPYSFSWDTTKLADGTHTIAVTATDGAGATVSSATLHETVDNTPPTAVIYQPSANSRIAGTATLQVHASDAFGVASVQFTIDGKPVGPPLTAPDAGQQYLYSTTYDTSSLAPGSHSVSAIVADNASNNASAAPVTITTGLVQYLPVLNYHEISPPDGYSIYDQTPAEADQQLAYLKANGYTSVTLDQYRRWLAGADIGVSKPVLITVDDALNSELAWDPLLKKYGFKAVMFVITGYADNTTPGDADSNNMPWSTIRSLAGNGRWEIAFHAGGYGHGDSYADGAKIGNATYSTTCPYFYTCLSQTTTGSGRNKRTTMETSSAYETAVAGEVSQGLSELRQNVPTASLLAWAAPFNDAGQWTNLYNDPAGTVQSWFPGFMASSFPIVFTQTNPVTYAQASGTVGGLTAFNRHYRFEVHTDTTIGQFAAALTDPAFAR